MTGPSPRGGAAGAGMVKAGPSVGITPDAVGRLADALEKSASTAGAIRQVIETITDRAAAAEISAAGGEAGAVRVRPGSGVPWGDGDPDGGVLQALMQQVPPVVKEIRARLSHFLACERDSAAYCAPGLINLPIDRSLWFTDEPVPDPRKVEDAIAFFNAHIGDSGLPWEQPAQGTAEVLGNWKQLTPAELDAVLNLLTPDQLSELNGRLGDGATWWGAGSPHHDVQNAFAGLILSSAATATVARIRNQLTELKLNPDVEDFPGNPNLWEPLKVPLFGPHGLDPDHIIEEYGPTCFFLAPLLGIASKNPGFIKSHIRQNDNGTYTVCLYQDGRPVDVTVTPDLPNISLYSPEFLKQLPASQREYLKSSPRTIAANDPNVIFSDGTWAALYEKAYAQLNGGYTFNQVESDGAIIGGGDPAAAMSAITGLNGIDKIWKGTTANGPPPLLASIQEKLHQGYIITAGTPEYRGNGGVFSSQRDQQGELILGQHAYTVRRVYTDPATKEQMIELVNPASNDSRLTTPPLSHYIHLTQSEFQKYFVSIVSGKV